MPAESYLSRGVSPTKDDVKSAIIGQTKGIFPGAFCKILPDPLGDPEYCVAMHADGAGTKSAVAYLGYKENANPSYFRGIAQDSLVMNLDDLICIGAVDNFLVSNTIGRNAHRIDQAVLKNVIDGYQEFIDSMKPYGITITMSGGETADVGDLVATIIVDSTVFVRFHRKKVIDCDRIQPGDVIVGLASFGQASYERSVNSGIGSNGLTAARHLLLAHDYATKYPETYSPTIEMSKVYCGRYQFNDHLPGSSQTVGEALLAPTRTYLPVIKKVLETLADKIHGMIHCTGGGQVKCKSFGKGLHYIKDRLFPTPPIFAAIKAQGEIKPFEMYQIFNMGHRLEVYCDRETASQIIAIAEKYQVEAKVVGQVEPNEDPRENKVTVRHEGEEYSY
ncbi:MAG TPA: AIR synthase-related protein [Bacillota bacterium]